MRIPKWSGSPTWVRASARVVAALVVTWSIMLSFRHAEVFLYTIRLRTTPGDADLRYVLRGAGQPSEMGQEMRFWAGVLGLAVAGLLVMPAEAAWANEPRAPLAAQARRRRFLRSNGR